MGGRGRVRASLPPASPSPVRVAALVILTANKVPGRPHRRGEADREPAPGGGTRGAMAGGAAAAPGVLLCALLWAVTAAAPGGGPAPGAFGRVYRGAVNISSERLYAFAYSSEPGQVGAGRWPRCLPPARSNPLGRGEPP